MSLLIFEPVIRGENRNQKIAFWPCGYASSNSMAQPF